MDSSRFFRSLIGLILIILASALLLNNLGLPDLSEIVRKMFWPLVVIAIGIFLFFSTPSRNDSKRPDETAAPYPSVAEGPHLRESKIAGELHIVPMGTYQKILADLALGKCVVDLTHTVWENGTGVADVQGLIGEINILIPAGVGVHYNCQCFIGAIHAEGRGSEGVGNRLNFNSLPEGGASTIELRVGLGIGEVRIFRV